MDVARTARDIRRVRNLCSVTCVLCTLLCISGCSVYGAGLAHMLMGNPKVKNDFTQLTGVELEESDQSLIILCSAPHSVTSTSPSVTYDIIDGVTRHLRARGIKVIPPDEVAEWMDDNGSWTDVAEVAGPLKAGFAAHLDLTELSWREPGSQNLFRGPRVRNHSGVPH